MSGSIDSVCSDAAARTNYRNVGGMTIKGVELESYYDSTYLFGSLTYSWATGKRDNPYTNPWATNLHVWARDIPPAKWVVVLGTKIPSWDAQVGWQGQFVRKTDRVPTDVYAGGLNSSIGDFIYDQTENASYDTQGLFANWKPQQAGLKGTEINFTVDNLFNRFYQPALSGEGVYSQGRNAKISITRFF